MHLFKAHAVKDLEAAASIIPVIDYGPYFAGEPGALQRLAEALRHACETVGFFYALNHGVPQDGHRPRVCRLAPVPRAAAGGEAASCG